MDKSHLFSRTARKPRSERNCSGFFLCRGIIKRCTPLGSKCTPHRPFVKWYRGVKRKRLHGDNFRITVEPVIVKKYMKTLANRSFYKKKLDTNQDTHCIKIGVQLWSEWRDLNSRPLGPEPSTLPTALHPDTDISKTELYCLWAELSSIFRKLFFYSCKKLQTVIECTYILRTLCAGALMYGQET